MFLVLSLTGCDDMRTAWVKVLRKCATNDTINQNALVYFGPSNTIGVGAIFRKTPDGGLLIRDTLANGIPDAADRAKIVLPGTDAKCEGEATSEWNIKVGVPIQALTTPISVGLSTAFSKASDIKVSVTNWSQDTLDEDQFELGLNHSGTSSFKNDFKVRKDTFIVERGIHVKGLSAELTFHGSAGVDVKATLADGLAIPIGKDGVTLTTAWQGTTTLKLSTPGDFYIAGELYKPWIIAPGGGRSGSRSTLATRAGTFVKPITGKQPKLGDERR